MPEPELNTIHLQECVRRWQEGDRVAADDLLRAAKERLEVLTRKMLRTFPNIRGLNDTADVQQGALLRLLATLRKLSPGSTREFFNLAAVHIRRELLDLARRAAVRPRMVGSGAPTDSGTDFLDALPDAPPTDDQLECWRRFHEAVEALPAEERELVGLAFYHGWTHAQIAELHQVNERTIRRRWQSACLSLSNALGGQLPQP